MQRKQELTRWLLKEEGFDVFMRFASAIEGSALATKLANILGPAADATVFEARRAELGDAIANEWEALRKTDHNAFGNLSKKWIAFYNVLVDEWMAIQGFDFPATESNFAQKQNPQEMQFNGNIHGIGMQINNSGSVIGNQGVVFTSSSGGLVANFSGSNLQIGGLPPAAQLKFLACDADGKELESFYLPLTPVLEVSADSIRNISTTSAPVTVRKANSVQQISTTNGDVVVHECESVQSVTTTNGDVTANKIGTAKTVNGDVKQRGRSRSPKRSKALVVNNSF